MQAGGKGSRLDVLTRERAKPALPFAGTYRLIDFALTSLTHSGISDVWLSVQYQAGSLHHHLASGRPWDLDRTRGGLRWLMPQEGGSTAADGFSNGNGDDLHQYSESILEFGADAVVVMSSDQVMAIDLREVLAEHLERQSDCTLVTTEVSRQQAASKTVLTVDDGSRVTSVNHKPTRPTGTTISAEVFVYDPEVLCSTLDTLRRERSHTDESNSGIGDFGEHLIPRLVDHDNVHAWAHHGYWADLGTPSSYLRAHRDLLSGKVDAVGDTAWPVITRSPDLPAARIAAGAVLEDAWVSPGCLVAGTVRRSVLGPGTVVAAGAVVEDSVLAERVRVDRDAHVSTSLLDERVHVKQAATVGRSHAGRRVSDDSIALIGRDSVIDTRSVIASGARLEPGSTA